MTSKRDTTRAEQVRTRRRQESQKRPMRTPGIANRTLPLVVSRTGPTYTAQPRTAGPTTKRRFQAAFSMAGFELRMPSISLPRVEIKSWLLSLFLCLLLGTAIYLSLTLPEFRVAQAQVSGNQRISTTDINSVLNSAGQPIFTLLPSDLETRLRLNYPELVSAQVILSLPNTLTVKIVERQPIILWKQGGGFTWIDHNGVAFRPRGTADHLIEVDAVAAPPQSATASTDPLTPTPYLSADMVKAIATLASSVPAGSTMVYDPRNGLGWSDVRGWKVTFGDDPKDMALKLQVYQSLVTSLTQKGITPAFISVQYANAPYYRMSQ